MPRQPTQLPQKWDLGGPLQLRKRVIQYLIGNEEEKEEEEEEEWRWRWRRFLLILVFPLLLIPQLDLYLCLQCPPCRLAFLAIIALHRKLQIAGASLSMLPSYLQGLRHLKKNLSYPLHYGVSLRLLRSGILEQL